MDAEQAKQEWYAAEIKAAAAMTEALVARTEIARRAELAGPQATTSVAVKKYVRLLRNAHQALEELHRMKVRVEEAAPEEARGLDHGILFEGPESEM